MTTPLSPYEDGLYHARQKELWVEQNQLSSYRCLAFHQDIIGLLSSSGRTSDALLEIGGGVGFDLKLFLARSPAFSRYVFSDVSPELAAYAARTADNRKVSFVACDARSLPFADARFDSVFTIASFHHLPEPRPCLKELARVTKPGGLIILGIEPNAFWMRATAPLKKLLHARAPGMYSPADEQAGGFSTRRLREIGAACGLTVVRIDPVWYFCGLLHYGNELLFRLFRCSRRPRYPLPAEQFLVRLDRALGRLPFLKELSWHFTVVYRKPG